MSAGFVMLVMLLKIDSWIDVMKELGTAKLKKQCWFPDFVLKMKLALYMPWNFTFAIGIEELVNN